MMVDFMDRDDQQMVNIQTEILEKAARHHLHIQFHGAYKPTGLSRTFPNEFTREGTLNYEVNKWDKRITPAHDLNMPFTRLLAGATDYHLGGFRAVPDSLFRVQYTRPLMLGTRCHMLGMYVVLESALAMVCDYPDAYEGQPGFEFIQQVPTVWDETRVLDAVVDKYIVIARRKGEEWFIGAINSHEAREVTIPLSFLGPHAYTLLTWSDAFDTPTNPNHLEAKVQRVTPSYNITIKMAPGGGFAGHIQR
jgi:alpha-glucosidase